MLVGEKFFLVKYLFEREDLCQKIFQIQKLIQINIVFKFFFQVIFFLFDDLNISKTNYVGTDQLV